MGRVAAAAAAAAAGGLFVLSSTSAAAMAARPPAPAAAFVLPTTAHRPPASSRCSPRFEGRAWQRRRPREALVAMKQGGGIDGDSLLRQRRKLAPPALASRPAAFERGRLVSRWRAPEERGGRVRRYATSLSDQQASEDGGDDNNDDKVDPAAWRLLGLAFLCMIICSLDRVAMSVAILPMSLEFGLSETTKGAISSVFSLGYMTSMLPAGILATSYSPKAVLTLGVAVWSIAQILSPAAAHVNLTTLLACRFAMGAAEAVATPTVQSLVGNWFPSSIRSRVVSLLASGLNLGVLLAYWASPALIRLTSWEDIFRVYGGLGLAWLALWVPLASDRPPQQQALAAAAAAPASTTAAIAPVLPASEGEQEEEQAATSLLVGVAERVWGKLTSVPWGDFVRSPELWAVTFAHMAHNYGLYVLLAWLPTYFSQTYGLDLKASSTMSVAPWMAAAVVSNLAGWGADALINGGTLSRTDVRKLFQCTALLVPALCMTALAMGDHSPSEAQAIFTLSVAAGSMSSAGFATATQDLADKYIGITYGASSALSVIVGSLGTFGTGVILDQSHEWGWVYGIAAGVYVAGAVAFAGMYKAHKIFD